jgi:mono/diheme cytochrome c family protein
MRITTSVFIALAVALAAAATTHGAQLPDGRSAAIADFAAICSRCHNANGSGYANLGIPNFTDPKWQEAHPDAELSQAIRNGLNNRMPPFGAALPPGEIRALVGYIREFALVELGGTPRAQEAAPIQIEPILAPPGHGKGPVVLGSVGVYTQHNDNARTGANLCETVLTPAKVNVRNFGLLFRHVVDDQVFAQPLYAPNVAIAAARHNVVFVASAANSLYAFDADRDAPSYWKVSLGPPGSVEQHHFWCLDIVGNMGIIGTPVIDPSTGTLYVVALTFEGNGFAQRLHALDIATGEERPGSPVAVTADGFDPILENQRPALLLSSGSLYVGYSSHCDVGPYHGFLFRFDPRTLERQGVLNLSPGAEGNSIWQSGQGPAADTDGSIYFVTSNGTWDGRLNLSDSFMRVDAKLNVRDWFTPTNFEELDKRDADLNSSGAMLIPGTHEVMGAGKQGIVYLVDRLNLGHLGDEHAVQHFQAAKGEINGGAVYWKSAVKGGLVYLWGQDDALHAFAFRNGRFNPAPVAVGRETSAYPGAMLSLSANGDADGILWANGALAGHGNDHVNGPGVLRAYDANDIARELWDSNMDAARDTPGRVSKNAPPTVVNGKVYLATFGALPAGTGSLCVYGELPGPTGR